MFAGAFAILPPSFETVFGDAVVCAQPDDVQTVVAAYYRDWTLFQAQSERGLHCVLENGTVAAYRRRSPGSGRYRERGRSAGNRKMNRTTPMIDAGRNCQAVDSSPSSR
jgi:hypothetical protein